MAQSNKEVSKRKTNAWYKVIRTLELDNWSILAGIIADVTAILGLVSFILIVNNLY